MGAAISATSLVTTGCGHGLPHEASSDGSTWSAQTQSGRVFYVHLPAGYTGNTAIPVYLSYHGAGKNAANQEALSGLSLPYFNPSGIAVYPESSNGYWLSHPGVSEASPNDIDYTFEILDYLNSNLCIDRTKVYASGKSNGGGLVNLLACNATAASKFAAFAGVSGAYYEDKLARNCAPGRVVPFLSFHGLNDTTIPYNGKTGCDSDNSDDCDTEQFKTTYPIDQWLADWVARDEISNSMPVNTTGLYGGLVTRSTWSRDCSPNAITHYKEDNLGHVWPSTYPNPDCPSPSSKCPLGHYTFNATTGRPHRRVFSRLAVGARLMPLCGLSYHLVASLLLPCCFFNIHEIGIDAQANRTWSLQHVKTRRLLHDVSGDPPRNPDA